MDVTMYILGLITFAAFAHLFVRGLSIGEKSKLLLGRRYRVL
ncbi:hypothetical protein SAHL_14215 [Salinisphaera orenii YIM 95161]|uniref:Uncharacterized protein n=1 Tax=Salinisphaera orenii YIM 95161 TaxID=1051139 RepID=A0A423PJ94_9GAMM|nr:hypothetical protein SAHL_14215 [Salinisphaera halophila YIM 95161]